MHRLDLGLYSHLKEFGGEGGGGGGGGDGVRTHVNSKEKLPSTTKILRGGDQIHNTASSRKVSPTHYQQAIQAPGASQALQSHFSLKLKLDESWASFCLRLQKVK